MFADVGTYEGVGLVLLLLALICAGGAVYLALVRREYVGAIVALILAIVLFMLA